MTTVAVPTAASGFEELTIAPSVLRCAGGFPDGAFESRRAMDSRNRSGVRVPPPLVFAIALAIGIGIDRDTTSQTPRAKLDRRLGLAAISAGLGLGALTFRALARAGTNPSPYAPTTALVTTFPFTFTRNPAYVGATAIYIGAALYARSIRALTFLPIALAVLDRLVVDPEERYLERIFGDDYLTYHARVPRWF